MALFGESIKQEIFSRVRERYEELGRALGEPITGEPVGVSDLACPLHEDVNLLVGVANGVYHRNDELVTQVDQAFTRLLGLLLGNTLHSRLIYPEGFWRTDIGIVMSRARWWVSGEDLITISNAASLAFGDNSQANRMRIARAMDNGVLDWVPDPSVINPQQNRRVLRSQVERLHDLRQLPR